MKSNLLFSFIFLGQLLFAQTFTEVPSTPFDGAGSSSIGFADVDGDGDNDLLITGLKEASWDGGSSKLYTNDGNSNFNEITGTSFADVGFSSVAFSDVDGDGDDDKDVLITGINSF